MLAVTIIALGSLKEPHYQAAAAEYLKRLAPYAKVEVIELKPEPFRSPGEHERSRQTEGERISVYIDKRPQSHVILLDEQGTERTSTELAHWLEDQQRPLIMIIGGALGVSDQVRKLAHDTLALSRLTLPHELARVMLLEQLYRATTISSGKTYHY